MSRKFNLQKPQVITIGKESGYIPKMLTQIYIEYLEMSITAVTN